MSIAFHERSEVVTEHGLEVVYANPQPVPRGHPDLGQPAVTEHGLLVLYGRFAAQMEVIDALNRVGFAMKTVVHSPGDKLNELFMHILAGGMHIKELETSPHPLVRDVAVAQAWGQESFASASGVSDLLRAASERTVAALKEEVDRLTEPYRRRVLRDLASTRLVVDLDLTAFVVSDQATTYEGAGFGYMGEAKGTARGYQFARAQLAGLQDPLLLGGFLHPGRTVSLHCLGELVALLEAKLGRPRRRVEAVERRLSQAEGKLAQLEASLTKEMERAKPRPPWREKLQERIQCQREEIAWLRARREEMVADNATNPSPRRILLRMDGGFGDGDRLGWLYEQGYDFVVRALSHSTADSLRVAGGLAMEKVTKNAFIAESGKTAVGRCPYPMRLFACRQIRGKEEEKERWTALIVNPELTPKDWPARRVGSFYNERQVIEASIKEGKGIFASRHLPTRHQAGIAIYQELVLLAQNLMRQFRRQYLGHTVLAAAGIKELVRIGANSRAMILRPGRAIAICFTGDSPWRGITVLSKEPLSCQLWFPFLEDSAFARAGP